MAAKYLLKKKCVFSDFENIAHCCYNGFEEDIYIYIYIYIYFKTNANSKLLNFNV